MFDLGPAVGVCLGTQPLTWIKLGHIGICNTESDFLAAMDASRTGCTTNRMSVSWQLWMLCAVDVPGTNRHEDGSHG